MNIVYTVQRANGHFLAMITFPEPPVDVTMLWASDPERAKLFELRSDAVAAAKAAREALGCPVAVVAVARREEA